MSESKQDRVKKMRNLSCVVVGAALALVSGCSLKGPSITEPTRQQTSEALSDYKKPYLTDDKMNKFIATLKDDKNPFETIFKRGATPFNPFAVKERLEEFNSWSRGRGFEGYEDYLAVWGRIMVGQMQIVAGESKKGLKESMEKTIAAAEEALKQPGITPEMKTMYEEQIKSAKTTMAEMDKANMDSALNADDQALVAKYNSQIQEALKKWQQ